MSSPADELRGSVGGPGAALAPGTPSPFDRLPGEDVPPDAGIAGDAETDPSVPPPATPSWFDASAFAKPSFDAAAYVDDMSAFVSMDALREELESYQRHLRELLVNAVNEDYDVFLSLGEGLVDVRKTVEENMQGPIQAFKRDVSATRAEIVELLNDLREKLSRRAECAERRATLELMLDANNVASKVERLLDQLDATHKKSAVELEPGTETNGKRGVASNEPANGSPGWTWNGPKQTRGRGEDAEDEDDGEGDAASSDAASDAAFESEVAAAAAAEVLAIADGSGDGLDALRPGVAADGPSAAALALADDVSDDFSVSRRAPSSSFGESVSQSGTSALRERCRLLERVAGEANRSRFFQTKGDEQNLAFVKGLRPRVERSEARLAEATAEAVAEACRARDAVAIARCLSAYVALGRVAEAERAIRETRVAPAVAAASKAMAANVSSAGSANDGGEGTAAAASPPFGALLETCAAAALRSVDVELEVTFPGWGLGSDDKSSPGLETLNLHARVCVLGECVLAEVDARVAETAPGAFTPGDPVAFFANHLAACEAMDVLERRLPPTKAALALLRDSPPVRAFFKRWNVAAYFALRRREIVARLEADLEEDRLTRAVAEAREGETGEKGRTSPEPFATAAAAGTYRALEKCFDTERVFLPRAADKFVKLAAQILARFGGWVAAGAREPSRAAEPSRASRREASAEKEETDAVVSGATGDETGDETRDPRDARPVVSWGATASDEDLLALRGDVEVLAARVETELAPRVAARLARTLGDAAAAASTEVLASGASALVASRRVVRDGDDIDNTTVVSAPVGAPPSVSATEALDTRLASDVVKRCVSALGQLKGVTATFRITNKPTPTKPSHFAAGVVEPLRRFAESEAVRRASAPTRRALVDAAVAGVCAAYAAAAADLTDSVRKTEASLIRLEDRKGEKEKGYADFSSTSEKSTSGPTDAEKICRQVRLDAEAFGRAVARLGFDTEKSDAFSELWGVCGEGEAFVA